MRTIIGVRDLIKLKKLEQNNCVKEMWCEEQLKDLERTFEMVDDLIACAIASTTSPQGYIQLQEAKATFVREFMDTAGKYRHI